jgi:predicted membrane protein (TIGR00267 family)
MNLLEQTRFLLRITRTHDIIRRYFVVNGFDGALTMLGLIIGFLVSGATGLSVIINVCLGAAIALGVSGVSSAYVSEVVSSAYVSEVAERKRALGKLEDAMITDLHDSAHGEAARGVPLLIALVNGFAPLAISLLILIPLIAANAGLALPVAPLYAAVVIALLLIFLLGVFLGSIAGVSWLWSGVQTLLVAILTAALIYLFAGH